MSLSQRVQQRFPQWVIGTHQYRGDETALLKRDGLVEVCTWLRDDPGMAFNFLMDVSCVDYLTFGHTQASVPSLQTPSPLPYFMKPKPVTETWQRGEGEEHRFEAVYHLYVASSPRR
ncbi:MAG: NADH-quinone oxidoreductase subunit C, partial [Candidatus Omnitrophica bacterium]|nr:NADH-quinone oxidoreductase subunit C [Candidatus Omnitrophota bacterium]